MTTLTDRLRLSFVATADQRAWRLDGPTLHMRSLEGNRRSNLETETGGREAQDLCLPSFRTQHAANCDLHFRSVACDESHSLCKTYQAVSYTHLRAHETPE